MLYGESGVGHRAPVDPCSLKLSKVLVHGALWPMAASGDILGQE